MNIVIGDQHVPALAEKYTVLELDTFRFPEQPDPVTSYCVVESLPIQEMNRIDEFRNLHTNMMASYRKKEWNYCEQALEHLRGRWNGELDTFYHDLANRVTRYRQEDPGEQWDGIIDRS